MSQNGLILAHLQKGRAIDPLMALQRYGVARLSARILELRAMGHPIISRAVKVRTRYGRPARISVYRLEP